MTWYRSPRVAVLSLALGAAIVATDALAAPARPAVEPIGEWSEGCNPGFWLSAMPSAWAVGPGQSIEVTTHLAVDFALLPRHEYSVSRAADGDDVYHLLAYSEALLQAEVRPLGSAEPVATLTGVRQSGKKPAVITWNGLDRSGAPVPPGFYEIEVRGRLRPSGSRLADGAAYADLAGVPGVAEACTRVLRVEVRAERVPDTRTARGATCAPAPGDYWASVDATNSSSLRATVHPVIDDHTRYPYTSDSSTDSWDVISDADEHPTDDSLVLDIYKNETSAPCTTGTGCLWNREHTWAKSYGFPDEANWSGYPYTDIHHLRASNPTWNSTRNNLQHDECTTGCTAKATDVNAGFGGVGQDNLYNSGADTWETWDHRKGDVARSILYMDVRYEGDMGVRGQETNLVATSNRSEVAVTSASPAYHAVLSTLVAWALADPPDSDEIRRNEQVWCYQQNRNPFVDHPEWVDCLYNGNCSTTGIAFLGLQTVTDPAPCAVTGVNLAWVTPSNWNDECTTSCSRGFNVLRDGTAITTGGCAGPLAEGATSCTDTTGVAGTTYTYSVEAFNDQAETSTGGRTVDGADRTSDGTAPVITVGPAATPASNAFTVTWTTDEPADSRLEYGLTSGYGSSTSDGAFVTSHSLTVTGLVPDTTYHYRVGSADACAFGPAWSSDATVTTEEPSVGGVDVSGWSIVQANSTYTLVIPDDTVIAAGGYLVVGRNATREDFEATWGVTLGPDVIYLDGTALLGGYGFPVINGGETYTLKDAGGTTIDGPTVALSATGKSMQRKDPCQPAGVSGSWDAVTADTAGNPGSGAGTSCSVGVVINEFSDRTSNYYFEFVELYNDAPGQPTGDVGTDFDGDGKADVFWRKASTGEDAIWLMNGTAIASGAVLSTVGAPWGVADAGDLDGDGKADVIWRNPTSGENAVWFMNGTAVASGALLTSVAAPWAIVEAGDFDGDGKEDLFWANPTSGESAIWLMNGSAVTGGAVLPTMPASWEPGVGDVDGDGKADILWFDTATGATAFWMMNGTTIASGGYGPTVATTWAPAGVGDFDGDGKSDLLWRNGTSGENAIWLLNGASVSSGAVLSTVGSPWDVGGVDDFDGDGKADIWWRDGSSGENAIWFMNGTAVASGGYATALPDVGWVVEQP